ncbi:hypothetical protein PILCRDRAFT_387571 [Piloderma croceum F 1598]|uniref:RBR-type E3 ubiquitin transferase n=1 Tax=Piloderma croceum (strain F 1598) TaxID=765440 RepID=A0A0C3C4J8_PILCF|nr:hypothetical protein PILCRDRAFT_387571 [Piloderma croceum F 1598]
MSDLSDWTVKLEVCVELGESRTVLVIDDGTVIESTPSENLKDNLTPPTTPERSQELLLSSLPPLILHLILPPNYPLHAPPQIVSLRATHSWFLRIPDLQDLLIDMWQAGEGVLYNWVESIRTAEFLTSMNIDYNSIIRLSHPAPHILSPHLASHDITILASQFSLNTYACAVCLESHKGTRCLQLSCGHIFCRSCLEAFWKLCIQEGDVGRVGCPDPECVWEAEEEEVARIVTPDEVERWRWLREKKAIEKDPTMLHCPLPFCQAAVPKPQGPVEDESGWSRLRTCQSCGFSFCSFCKRTWHGPLSDCPISVTESVVSEYVNLEEDSPKRVLIERRYGKATILRLVAKYEEDRSNAEWFTSSTMPCPGCRVHVEKSAGCNHMTCAKCAQHFCYRCGAQIDPSSPYKHFNIPGTSCWSKLFEFRPEDAEWQPVEAFDAL